MTRKYLNGVVAGLILVLIGTGIAGGGTSWQPTALDAQAAAVASAFTYQGRLTDTDGKALTGTYTMRFILYDAAAAGNTLSDSGSMAVAVEDGLFTVRLEAAAAAFNGQAMWLSINVEGQTLSPRQEILSAPYALGLRPGTAVVGDALAANDAVLGGYAPATGTALRAEANGGAAVQGFSGHSYGVWGVSDESWGGYFTSAAGHGIRVETGSSNHFDHGAYVTATGGYGVYAQSANNQGIRGEAGDVSNVAQPLGAVGVVGLGSNRGTYGASSAGVGVYGVSNANYGIWGQSTTLSGVTGRTSRSDNNYGFYTPDNLFALNASLVGSVTLVMQNGGSEPLTPGDVVVFAGIVRPASPVDSLANNPMVLVEKADGANRIAVAGVVQSRFNLDALDSMPETADGTQVAAVELIPAGSAAPGEHVLVVVQGPVQVRASTLEQGDIRPGDLLSTGPHAGSAARSATVQVSGVETAIPGTVFAKALEPLADADGMIYVYVTLQ